MRTWCVGWVVALLACGGSPAVPPDGGPLDSGAPLDAPASLDAGADAAMTAQAPIYAASDPALYRFDPTSGVYNMIGNFDCVGGTGQDSAMTDIALASDGTLYAVSNTHVHVLAVEGSVVHCASSSMLGQDLRIYALAVAPPGVVDASETVVGATTAGELYAIDPSSGAVVQHGTFGTVPASDPQHNPYANAGTHWELAGDLVFARDALGAMRGWVTLVDCPAPPSVSGCSMIDSLAELDLTAIAAARNESIVRALNGQIRDDPSCPIMSPSPPRLSGFAASEQGLLAFDRSGAAMTLDATTGSACGRMTMGAPLSLAGAASSSAAMLSPP